MQIVKLEIQNFRNIKSATYNLFEITAIVGKNHLGKTNTLHALYWLLSDSLLDNSKQFDSITPKDDNRALTSVKVTLDDGFTIAKTYRELWQKQRGSAPDRLIRDCFNHGAHQWLGTCEGSDVASHLWTTEGL